MPKQLTSVTKPNYRKRGAVKQSPAIGELQTITNKDTELETQLNQIWDAVKKLDKRTTQSVKEAELKRNRKHPLEKVASMSGEYGSFRLKETSSLSNPNKIEICGKQSWQTLAARLPDYEDKKVAALQANFAAGDPPTQAEYALVISDLNTLKTKLNSLITALSNTNIFKLEDIEDENPNIDRDTTAIDWR